MPTNHPASLLLDHTHCRAICDEVGERLREILGRESSQMPPYLSRLIDQLGKLDRVSAPAIVPLIEDLHSSAIIDVLEPA
jgi:hypothetical protein